MIPGDLRKFKTKTQFGNDQIEGMHENLRQIILSYKRVDGKKRGIFLQWKVCTEKRNGGYK